MIIPITYQLSPQKKKKLGERSKEDIRVKDRTIEEYDCLPLEVRNKTNILKREKILSSNNFFV